MLTASMYLLTETVAAKFVPVAPAPVAVTATLSGSIYPVPPTPIAAVSISPLIIADAAAPTDGLSPAAGTIVIVGGVLKPRPL